MDYKTKITQYTTNVKNRIAENRDWLLAILIAGTLAGILMLTDPKKPISPLEAQCAIHPSAAGCYDLVKRYDLAQGAVDYMNTLSSPDSLSGK